VTRKRDLKKQVRARMNRTGESYTNNCPHGAAASRHPPSAIPRMAAVAEREEQRLRRSLRAWGQSLGGRPVPYETRGGAEPAS
jgi:hypothetical protein